MQPTPAPEGSARARFAALLRLHLKEGTRPSGKRGGHGHWTKDAFRFAIGGVSLRIIDYYCSGAVVPPEISKILDAFFGDDPRHAQARKEFIRAYELAWGKKSSEFDEARLDELYHKAFLYSEREPEASLVFSLKYAEAFCLGILESDCPESLDDAINILHSRSLVPAHLVPPLRSVHAYGNAALRERLGRPIDFRRDYVRPCLGGLAMLHGWHKAKLDIGNLEQEARIRSGNPTQLRVADCRLTVVKAIQIAWDLDEVLSEVGLSASHIHYPWSNRLLEDLAAGTLDITIYNKLKAEEFISNNPSSGVAIIGSFGHSMGGGNFYLLGHRDSRWSGMSYDDFKSNLGNATIAVPYASDIADNIHIALSFDAQSFRDRDIRIIHVPATSGLEIFQLDRDLLVSAGQNLRMLAQWSGDYEEVLNIDKTPTYINNYLMRRAENCMVMGRHAVGGLNSYSARDMYNKIYNRFHMNWRSPERFDVLLKQLCSEVEFDGVDGAGVEFMTRSILYKTYRIGDPP